MIDDEGELTETRLAKALEDNYIANDSVDLRELLEVLERWLTEFLPDRYETTRDSVKLIRRKIV